MIPNPRNKGKLLSREEAKKYLKEYNESGEEPIEAVRTAYLHGWDSCSDMKQESEAKKRLSNE